MLGIVIKTPIILCTNYAKEIAIDTDIILKVQDKAFLLHVNEDPYTYLMTFDALCGSIKLKDMSREFVLLNFFRWSLKDMANEWFDRLSHNCITSWKSCIERLI